MNVPGSRQHAPEDDRGKPPVAALPIRDEHTRSVEEPLEQGLDSFDSEVSLGMLDRSAHLEDASDLELFPPEGVDPDTAVVVAAPASVVVPRADVAADQPVVAVSIEPIEPMAVAAPAQRAPVVVATPQRAPVSLTRRLALVAGILACLGVPTVGILLWRSPARVVAPVAVLRDAVVPSSASVAPQTPTPTLLATTPPTASSTIEPSEPATTSEPSTTSEPLMSPEPVTDDRGPIGTPARAAAAPPPALEPTARPGPLTQGISADATAAATVPIAAEPTPAPINAAPTDLEALPSVRETPVAVNLVPSVDTPAAPLPPAAAPVSAPAVADAGSATAVTLAPAPARDAADIQMVLTQYRSAFSDLDATAVSKVWPNADSRALARAFRGLEEQGIAFDNCDIRVAGTSAAASCGGTVRYVTKVGSKDPRTEQRRWQFTLGKVRDLWVIQSVESR